MDVLTSSLFQLSGSLKTEPVLSPLFLPARLFVHSEAECGWTSSPRSGNKCSESLRTCRGGLGLDRLDNSLSVTLPS